MAGEVTVITSDYVTVNITNSAQESAICNERRFQKGITVSQLKGKLELMTGGSPTTMKIELYSKDDKFICALENNDALLGSYPIDDGMRLHVVDSFTMYNDLSSEKIERYELTPEQYAKKQDSVRAFLLKNKMGKYNEEEMRKRKEQQARDLEEEKKLAAAITLGSRCKVTTSSAPERLGTVAWIGKMEGRPGYWVGVRYDEPLGKNDGTYEGKRYFDCEPKYGGFVKPGAVLCGDFPVEDYDLNEEI